MERFQFNQVHSFNISIFSMPQCKETRIKPGFKSISYTNFLPKLNTVRVSHLKCQSKNLLAIYYLKLALTNFQSIY